MMVMIRNHEGHDKSVLEIYQNDNQCNGDMAFKWFHVSINILPNNIEKLMKKSTDISYGIVSKIKENSLE